MKFNRALVLSIATYTKHHIFFWNGIKWFSISYQYAGTSRVRRTPNRKCSVYDCSAFVEPCINLCGFEKKFMVFVTSIEVTHWLRFSHFWVICMVGIASELKEICGLWKWYFDGLKLNLIILVFLVSPKTKHQIISWLAITCNL